MVGDVHMRLMEEEETLWELRTKRVADVGNVGRCLQLNAQLQYRDDWLGL